MEVLRYQNPFEIFFGRQHEKHTPLPNLSQMKQRDKKSTAKCVQRMKKYRMNASKPSTYKIGEKVFIRFPSCKSRIPRRTYILQGTVLERRLKTHKYLIQFYDPINESFKTEWIGWKM